MSDKELAAVATERSNEDDIPAASLLNDQWKWRHQHCWRLLTRFGLTAFTVSLIPYLRRLDLIKLSDLELHIKNWELFFPLSAWFIAQSAVYLFAEEYIRCRPLETMCFRILERQGYSPMPKNLHMGQAPKPRTTLFASIGQTTIFGYSALATLFTFFSIWIMIKIGVLHMAETKFDTIGAILAVLAIFAAGFFAKKAGQRIERIIKNQEIVEKALADPIGISHKDELAQSPATSPEKLPNPN